MVRDDQNKPMPRREDQKMDSEIERTILASERKSGRLEDRLTALESTVNFLVTQISEGRGPIKSELQLYKKSHDAPGPYDSWPHDPMEW
jgi:hypothetical protein